MSADNSFAITLRGEAAVQAQHLIAELIDASIDFEQPEREDVDRSAANVITEVVIVFGVHATYDLAKSMTLRWMGGRAIPPEDVEFTDSSPDKVG